MTIFPLEILWYWVIGLATTFYVILDGFDLGVGMLHLFVKKDEERRIFLNAIGPIWDGNELWLVIVGGALFAGFPHAYATLFSGFYNLCMAFLAAIIFRSAAIEFRSKSVSTMWRKTWDVLFSLATYLISFGLGVVLGNLILGIELNMEGDFVGTFSSFFRPYPLLIGLLSVSVFQLHGALFLLLKTEGELSERIRKMASALVIFFIIVYVAATIVTLFQAPHMLERMLKHPIWFLLPLLTILSILNVPRLIAKKRDGIAFVFSSLSILFLFSLFGVGTYPMLVRSSVSTWVNSITIFNAASSALTLKILLLIVVIGVPLILAYGFFLYRTFRGKVKLYNTSY